MITLIYLLSLISLQYAQPLLTDTKDNVTQNIYEVDVDMYLYTYQDTTNDDQKIYQFTTEQIITCFLYQATVDTTNYVYLNVITVSFSVQFEYTDTDTTEIAVCTQFADEGAFNVANTNERRFHNNMLNYSDFKRNFDLAMTKYYGDTFTYDDTKLQEDHDLIANEEFIDQTKPLNENLDLNLYHILSSHNTYLEGNFYYGKTVSERALVRQLFLGFRCFELDIWPEPQPQGSAHPVYVSIQHQFLPLQTNNIDLKSTLKILFQYGFLVDDSPIVINFENHLNTLQEYQYFIDALDNSGLTFLLASSLNDNDAFKYENLKNQVIINMDFNLADKNIVLNYSGTNLNNDALNDTYQNQYIEEPLSQFLSGASFLSYMIDKIEVVTASELSQIQSDFNTVVKKSQQNNLRNSSHKKQQEDQQENLPFRTASTISGTYYDNNDALEYVSITKDCYPDVNNMVWFALSETILYQNLKENIQSLNKNFPCKSMIRVYTGFYRVLSGNYNPLDGIALKVNIIALNGQNIDTDVVDYINLFNSRTGYRPIDYTNYSIYKKYRIQIDEIYIPDKSSLQIMNIRYFRRDKDYQKTKKVKRICLVIKDGRNTTQLQDYKFKARDEDFLYFEVGIKYRFSIMVKDLFLSGQTELENNTYKVAILRTLKNYLWDGAFMKLRVIEH